MWPCPMKPHMLRQSWSTDRQFTHCTDPVTYTTATKGRHTVVQQRCNIAQTTAQKRKQNHANTRAHQKTSSQHDKKYFLVRQSTHRHTQRTLHNGRYVLFSSTVLQPTLPRTINGKHVMGTAQDADTEINVRGRRELRQYTWRTDAREHQSSVSNPLRKNEHR